MFVMFVTGAPTTAEVECELLAARSILDLDLPLC